MHLLKYSFLLLFPLVILSCGKTKDLPPNIIIIMADDLGYGDLSCYGNSDIQTPHLDRLASEGMLFIDFHSNGAVCSPTRAALMSGKYQQRVGISQVVATWTRDTLGMSPKVETLAEVFREAGYATGIFGKWHLGYRTDFNPLVQGFDEFKGFVAGNVDYHSHLDNLNYFDWWEGKLLKEDPGYTTDLITEYGVDFLKRNAKNPFFLYLPHEAPHAPYQKRTDIPIRQKDQKDRQVSQDDIPGIYKEMVELMDEGIGEILSTLTELGLTKNTFIFFCSDNGANKNGSNGALRGYKGGLFEGGHRVPAIAYWPGKIVPGTKSDETLITMDLFPTLMEMANIPLHDRPLDGLSFLQTMLTNQHMPKRKLYWHFDQYGWKQALRDGDWKLVDVEGEVSLFNLAEDLGEKEDLSKQYPDRLQQMLKDLATWKKSVDKDARLLR